MANEIVQMDQSLIQGKIATVRGVQVMLDRDLAELYGVPTKRLNEQVKRNRCRFPANFMFQLDEEDLECLRSQIATSNVEGMDGALGLRSQIATSKRGGARYKPYAFTEHGILLLASVLNSEVAMAASVRIMETFVAMRKMLASLAPLLARIEANERRQITDQAHNEERFKLILDAMRDKEFPPQKIFFDGQFFDAFAWVKKCIRSAKNELIVVDPYFEASVLPQLAQKRLGVKVLVVRCKRGKRLLPDVDIQKFNAQYANTLTVKESELFHDRFLVIDRKTLIHIGASLNYLGKKCFAVSTFDPLGIPELIAKLPQ